VIREIVLSLFGAVFHVSPAGDDAWTGLLAAPNAGRSDGPFATLERARDAARALPPGEPRVVRLRGGTYRLRETLRLGPDDSGLVLEAYPGETPVVSGAVPVTGFREVSIRGRRFFEAPAPDAPWDRRQLFAAGRRRGIVRHPKSGFLRFESLPDASPETPWHEGQTRARFSEGDLAAFQNFADVEIVALHFWVESRLPLAAIDEKDRIASFSKRSVFRLTDDHSSRPARYYVAGALEHLSEPGEWCADSKAGRVVVAPLPGETAGSFSAEAPALERLVAVAGEGETGRVAEEIVFRGITFAHAAHAPFRGGPGTWPRPDVAGPPQAAVTLPAAIEWTFARGGSIEDCTVEGVGGYAISLGEGCVSNAIRGCALRDLGGGGVKIGTTAIPASEASRAGGNSVTDCVVAEGGLVAHSAVGIWIGQSGGNRIAHNEVRDVRYTGISVGWTWGYGASAAKGNTIESNVVSGIGGGWLSDMGAIYTLGPSEGTVIRGNVFRDVESAGYGGWGIYFDEGTTGVVAEGNLVHRTKSSGFHQHYGRDNVVRNNVFAFGRESQVARSRAEEHLSFTFEGNVVLWRAGDLLSGNFSGNEGVRFDRNVYFRTDGQAPSFAGATLEEWRARGHDRASLVADPLCADPEGGDFTLRDDSPARPLGILPIDVSRAGPRKKKERAGE